MNWTICNMGGRCYNFRAFSNGTVLCISKRSSVTPILCLVMAAGVFWVRVQQSFTLCPNLHCLPLNPRLLSSLFFPMPLTERKGRVTIHQRVKYSWINFCEKSAAGCKYFVCAVLALKHCGAPWSLYGGTVCHASFANRSCVSVQGAYSLWICKIMENQGSPGQVRR